MRKIKLADGIYHARFTTQRALAETFMRFQEYYESPNDDFRRKSFSLDTFKKWYSKTFGNGKFTYCSDWSGFNIPGWVLTDFAEGKMEDLTKKEERFISKFTEDLGHPFYVIGTHTEKGKENALAHEIAHAIYCVSPQYRKRVDSLIRRNRLALRPLYRFLRADGYWGGVLADEAHAYLVHDREYLEEHGVDTLRYDKLIKRLAQLYKDEARRLKLKLPKK